MTNQLRFGAIAFDRELIRDHSKIAGAADFEAVDTQWPTKTILLATVMKQPEDVVWRS